MSLTNPAYADQVKSILRFIGLNSRSTADIAAAFPDIDASRFVQLGMRQGWLQRVNCCVDIDSMIWRANRNMVRSNYANINVVDAIPSLVPPKLNTAQYIPGVGYFDPTERGPESC